MVMAVDPSLVKLDTSEAGIPTAFKDNQALSLMETYPLAGCPRTGKQQTANP